MAKSKFAAKNKSQPKKVDNEGKGRTVCFTKEAGILVEEAERQGYSMARFVSQCVSEYAPILLHKKSKNAIANVNHRLIYLEEIVLGQEYDSIIEQLKKNKAVKAHKKLINNSDPTLHPRKRLDLLLEEAESNKKTQDTERYEWAVLLAMKDKFLALEAD